MADSDLSKQAGLVIESLQALTNSRSGLAKIRRQLLNIKIPPTPQNLGKDVNSSDTFISAIEARSTMDYRFSSDFHQPHTLFYVPGTGSINPEYSKF